MTRYAGLLLSSVLFLAEFTLSWCNEVESKLYPGKRTAISTYRDGSHSNGWGWGSNNSYFGGTSIQSFFDIALTALAFLSFGVFLLNLLLNALLFTTGTGITTGGPILTNTGTGTGTGTGTVIALAREDSVHNEKNVQKRSIGAVILDSDSFVHALAQGISKSTKAFSLQDPSCTKKAICEENFKAVVLGNGLQYVLPLYSITTSYAAEWLGFHDDLPGHLDAIVTGISEAPCKFYSGHC